MKKIYLIIAGTLLGSGLFAQASSEYKAVKPSGDVEMFKYNALNKSISRSTIVNHTISFTDDHASYYSSTPTGFWRTIFPDSTTPIQYTSTVGFAYIHHAAQVFDLSSPVVNAKVGGPSDGFDPSIPATLDSINLVGYYAKGSKGYVDTIIVTVVDYIGDFVSHPGQNAAIATQWATDTVRSFAIEMDTFTFDVKNQLAQYKIALDLADTSATGLMLSTFPAGVSVDGRFAIDVAFKPGGAYTTADTSNKQLGFYRLYTSEPNGDGTQMSYIKNDRSGASFYTKFDRYKSTIDRYQAPFHFYAAGQSDCFEIEATLSQLNSRSIIENVSSAKLFQNYPNPTNGMTTVKYELENGAQVSFEMIDVTGKKVLSSTEGNKTAGVHTIDINTDKLNAGIYFYSIIVDGAIITKKMTITK